MGKRSLKKLKMKRKTLSLRLTATVINQSNKDDWLMKFTIIKFFFGDLNGICCAFLSRYSFVYKFVYLFVFLSLGYGIFVRYSQY